METCDVGRWLLGSAAIINVLMETKPEIDIAQNHRNTQNLCTGFSGHHLH
jgi:hypothetical protein